MATWQRIAERAEAEAEKLRDKQPITKRQIITIINHLENYRDLLDDQMDAIRRDARRGEPDPEGMKKAKRRYDSVEKLISDLIAAAPELLNACIVALSQLTEDRPEYTKADIDQIKRAITKATGGQL